MVFYSLYTAKCNKTRVKYCAVYVKKASNGKLSDDVKDKTLPFLYTALQKDSHLIEENCNAHGQNHDFYHSIKYIPHIMRAKLNTEAVYKRCLKAGERYYRDMLSFILEIS